MREIIPHPLIAQVFVYFCPMEQEDFYRKAFEDYLASYRFPETPVNLYQPINYILGLGGKRIRPSLSLIACEMEDGSFENAFPAALAVEIFHNFSLVHDDIMDGAPLRRGRPTVHNRWDINTGILSGDAMLIKAYQLLEDYKPAVFRDLSRVFSATAVAVCEGQQLDMDFESRSDVTLPEYLEMIRKKTAVLLGASMQMGAAVAGADKERQERYFRVGENLGVAFQIQDDYLDAFGDPDTFGKQVGGDIIENKKTFLYLKALELADKDTVSQLQAVFADTYMDPLHKVNKVKGIYQESGVAGEAARKIKEYTEMAYSELGSLGLDPGKEGPIHSLAEALMARNS